MAERDAQVQAVLVEIFGERYHIGGDPQQVQQVAAHVDARMKKIADGQPRMPKAQVAILAAMEVTAELLKVMSERKAFTDRAHERIERLSQLVEDRAHMSRGGRSEAEVRATGGNRLAADANDPPPVADRLRQREAVRLPGVTAAE